MTVHCMCDLLTIDLLPVLLGHAVVSVAGQRQSNGSTISSRSSSPTPGYSVSPTTTTTSTTTNTTTSSEYHSPYSLLLLYV